MRSCEPPSYEFKFDFTAHHVVVFFTRSDHVPSFISRSNSTDVWLPILHPVGSCESTSPFLNTLPVCSTIRVDSMLCAIVCNLRKRKRTASALYSLKGLATIMTYCVNPTRNCESFEYKPQQVCCCHNQRPTETCNANTTLSIPRTR